MDEPDPHVLSIGAVAKLTGIPADTIRTWERRHSVVQPARDARGRRLYARADVAKLSALSRLAQQGERVADLASLSPTELQDRILLHDGPARALPEEVRVAAVHPASRALAGAVPNAAAHVAVVAEAKSIDLLPELPVDILVVELRALGASPLAALASLLERMQPDGTVVTYHFAPRLLGAKLEALGVRLVQGSAPAEALRRAIYEVFATSWSGAKDPVIPSEPPRTVLSRDALEQLLNSTPSLLCECPNHLASLAIAMREFELYSLGCESKKPTDQALHADLAHTSGRMRAELEQLILRVCAQEGIDLPTQ